MIQFFPAPKNSSDFEQLMQSDADIIIFSEANVSSIESLRAKTEESIPLAYHPVQPGSKNELGKSPVTAFISKETMQPTKSIRFARFLAAPSRGQYYFAQGNWIGVNGDFWSFTPEIKVATPFFKPSKNQTDRRPDFFIHETDQWLIFPHELEGLTFEDIKENKPELKNLLEQIKSKI